jgi:maltose alpha-D-glucosyltransferase/alpha-amylase
MKLAASARDPLWYKDAIIYETHVKAFFDSNGDGIGDFGGLIQKLDYLQELGVTCLWVLPFFPSPLRDDGYDIADYLNVHPSYGTLDDCKAFIRAAHERNLQVVFELVINHTSDQHPWFQAARHAAPGSPERDFYVWSDTDQKYKEVRIIFIDTEKSNWTWDPVAQAYYWHRFFSHQPDLNFDNPAVITEVVKAMNFWLDLGVDGLRLDAIPYLVERDGTNCENLPDTHKVIKQIRSALDSRYANRMLLAEANQWPPDVRPYFGDGDSCHMAFHFPVMPRLFMAVRTEDRHPITDIMAQTPEIPDNCQWGMFLRNHDELTLEMVTDEERDYMYLAYSADPRMRLNLGIRRRLAPLMENNRRRIELLNSLLFSFPGTPILYYGDEIGMGDNIYLGDRNGVRTPMQWSADRNAGFSRANPARLYSPVIMDPVYGYEAVNVEAQVSDHSSLLHWMRNMIGLRKLFKVFGRGTLEFLHPKNRKILAYLRRYENEQVLCVANLSRVAQPVELDLGALAGMTPVEMLGYTEFPAIGRDPYPLTLGPYGFYWFELQGTPAPIEVPEEKSALVALPAGAGWDGLLEGRSRDLLETRVLPQFLPGRRWFGGKARKIKSTRVRDWAPLSDGSAPAALVLFEVDFEDGGQDVYFAPLALALGAAGEEVQSSRADAVLCRVTSNNSAGVVYDASFNDDACQALLAAIEQQRSFPARRGEIRGFPTIAFSEVRGAGENLPVRRGDAEQSNTSILFGDRMIMKLFRRLEPGQNPDFELGRHLTERAQFDRTPKLAGGIEYHERGSEPATVAMLQALVPNQGDGWQWTLEELSRYFEHCSTLPPPSAELFLEGRSLLDLSSLDVPQEAHEAIGMFIDAAATLGRRTAEMHLALSRGTEDPDLVPEPITPADLSRLSGEFRGHARKVFDALKENLARLPDENVDTASLALSRRHQIIERFRKLENMPFEGLKIRIHGDYHLGQVLSVKNDFVILDFEGEPARSLAERRAKHSPLKDVAGMLRSFSYAAYVSLLNLAARRPDEFERMEPWARVWERWVSAMFLKAYLETTAGLPLLPRDQNQVRQLLESYVLDKTLYELLYELNNRPAWVRIPLSAILSLG